jgi:site-specific recombinase XerD
VSHAISRVFKRSGVDFKGRKHGSHALRSTFATKKADEGVPAEVLEKLLGQKNPNSKLKYVKTNISNLRSCVLDPPAPTGAIAQFLGEGGEE